MTLLSILLLGNALLHGVIVARFGIRGNAPPAVFGILYAALALVVFSGWTHAPIAVLVVTAVGLVGLAANFKKLQHDTTVEKIVFVVGALILASAAYSLLIH